MRQHNLKLNLPNLPDFVERLWPYSTQRFPWLVTLVPSVMLNALASRIADTPSLEWIGIKKTAEGFQYIVIGNNMPLADRIHLHEEKRNLMRETPGVGMDLLVLDREDEPRSEAFGKLTYDKGREITGARK